MRKKILNEILSLQQHLRPLTQAQTQFASSLFSKVGYLNTRGEIWCQCCGHVHRIDKCTLAIDLETRHQCSKCGTLINLEKRLGRSHNERYYVTYGTHLSGWQVFRTFLSARHNEKKGTDLNTTAEYNPYKLTSSVKQLALLPVKLNGDRVEIASALEVINWQAGGELMIESETPITFQGMDFNFGVNGVAKHFRLELFVNGAWKEVGLLHYRDDDPVIHTGNELGGMTATKLRITNKSGEEQKVYFKSFTFIRR